MVEAYHLYIDDSGTRNPDRRPQPGQPGNWFGLGGVLVRQEDECQVRKRHSVFVNKWDIRVPLHSSEIRGRNKNFRWLKNLEEQRLAEFHLELTDLIIDAPFTVTACVIDRVGCDKRYGTRYERRDRWFLCKTAFCILVERAAKFARSEARRLRVLPEASDKTADGRLRKYYAELREEGMPFDVERSARYDPLNADELSQVLYELRFKRKSSPLVQMADLVLYPLCRYPYHRDYLPYRKLVEARKLIDHQLEKSKLGELGVKYSCFD